MQHINTWTFCPELVKKYLNGPKSFSEVCLDDAILEKIIKKQQFLEKKGVFDASDYFQGLKVAELDENDFARKIEGFCFYEEENEVREVKVSKVENHRTKNNEINKNKVFSFRNQTNSKKYGQKSFSQHLKENSTLKNIASPKPIKSPPQSTKNATCFTHQNFSFFNQFDIKTKKTRKIQAVSVENKENILQSKKTKAKAQKIIKSPSMSLNNYKKNFFYHN